MLVSLLLTLPMVSPLSDSPPAADAMAPGPWRAWLDSPGGDMPFGLDFTEAAEGGWRVEIVNGSERISVPRVEEKDGAVLLAMEHYDSRIRAALSADGKRLDGEWEKRRGPDAWGRMPFHAAAGAAPRFAPEDGTAATTDLTGHWAVDFASDELPAVGIFAGGPGTEVTGTFLTATGDYRFLAGNMQGDHLRLSVFDGAHAFLFDARVQADGSLAGNFWSGGWWHETWTATRDDDATLGDAFAQTRWIEGGSLADLVLPDLTGRARSLVEAEFAGRAIVLQLFGSWCPNCHDETKYLTELHGRYAARGLSILGLAFELSGEFERDAAQVRTLAARYGVPYPLFLAGTADKAQATAAFALVDRVRSFPTTIFLTADGRVHSVHSGFAGPATGEAHAALRAQFESTIEELLAAPPVDDTEVWEYLCRQEWYSAFEFAGATYAFGNDASGARLATYTLFGSGRPVIREDTLPVRLLGDALWAGDQLFRIDPIAHVLQDPRRFGYRLTKYDASEHAFLEGRGYAFPDGLPAALADPDPRVRREAVYFLAQERAPRSGASLPEALPLLTDADVHVRIAAAWAFAELQDHAALPALLALRTHPHAALRREVTSALVRMSKKRGADLRAALAPLADDPDPIVRERARARLAEY